jgi:hypothetical protein
MNPEYPTDAAKPTTLWSERPSTQNNAVPGT